MSSPRGDTPDRRWPDVSGQRGIRLVPDAKVPEWMWPVLRGVDGALLADLISRRPDTLNAPFRRRSAVLVLLADGPEGPDVLLTARAATLRSHAGQPAFPGGSADPGETAVQTALREATEETGLDPSSVTPAAIFPELALSFSGFLVSPVLGYWHAPGPVEAVDPGETAAVARVSIAELADPEHRSRIRHPSGFTGPAFEVADMIVWGFTANLIDALLRLGGWARPWNSRRFVELPSLAAAMPDPEAGHLGEDDAAAGWENVADSVADLGR